MEDPAAVTAARSRWRAGMAALWVMTASLAAAQAAAIELPAQARAGDLVFREGTAGVSAAVLSVDGGPYSHVGMLLGEPGQWQVIHATPAEVPGRADGVVIDTLDFYLAPERALQHAIYHVHAEDSARAAAVRAAHARLGEPFRLAEPGGTYCTELVWSAWQSAGVDLDVTFTPLALPLIPGRYLLPRDLAASARLQVLPPTERTARTH